MKQFILLLATVVTFYCCKKDSKISETGLKAKQTIELPIVQNGHLVFRSHRVLQYFFDQSPEVKKNVFRMLEPKFVSYAETHGNRSVNLRDINGCEVPDSIIEDEEDFFSTLDEYGIVQVGSDLYRYDYCDGKFYIISTTAAFDAAKYSNFMSGNLSDTNVRWFSLETDIYLALDSGYRTEPDSTSVLGSDIFNRQVPSADFVETKHDFSQKMVFGVPVEDWFTFKGELYYRKFGFFFVLRGKEWVLNHEDTPLPKDFYYKNWYVEATAQWQRRRDGTNYSSSGTYYPDENNNVWKRFYAGGRKLSKYYIRWNVFDTKERAGNTARGNLYIGGYEHLGYGTVSNYDYNKIGGTSVIPFVSYYEINYGY